MNKRLWLILISGVLGVLGLAVLASAMLAHEAGVVQAAALVSGPGGAQQPEQGTPTPTCQAGVQCPPTATATPTCQPAVCPPTDTPTCQPGVQCASPTPTCQPGVPCATATPTQCGPVGCDTPTATRCAPDFCSPTPTRTPRDTRTPTATQCPNGQCPSPSATPTFTQHPTDTATATQTQPPSNTPTATNTRPATATPTCQPGAQCPTATATSCGAAGCPTATATNTRPPTGTPTATICPNGQCLSPTATACGSAGCPSPSATPTCQAGVQCPSATATACGPAPCGTPTATATRTSTATATRTSTVTSTRTPTATPTCIILGHYTATVVPATMIPGTLDVGNHCNDCVTGVDLPFPVQFYGDTYSKAVVSSNGNLQFVPESASSESPCLPNPNLDAAIMLYQGDLDTSAAGDGIFSATLGTEPNRTFVLEWRTHYVGRQGTSNEELIFAENSSTITMVYGANADDGSGEVSGMQQGSAGPSYDEYSCHAPNLTNGKAIIWPWFPPIIICTPTPTRTATRTPTPTPTACITTVLNNGFESGTLEGYTSVVATCVPGGCGWINTTTAAHTGSRSLFAPDVNNIADQQLTSPAFVVPAGATLSFWHRYALEHPLWDGGEIEIKVGSGPWATVTPATIVPPYPAGTIPGSFSNPLVGKQGWTNTNPSWPAFNQVTISLAAYAGQTIQYRFRLGTDIGNAGTCPCLGWWIDDIKVTGICNTPTPQPTCIPPPPGMTYWYPLDEASGGTSAELIGGNNGTWHNAPVPNIGQYVGNSLSFNGTNQWVAVPGANSPAFGIGNFSVDTWIKVPPTALLGTSVFIDNRSWMPQGFEFFLYGNRLGIQMADTSGYSNFLAPVSSPYPADGQWHLVAVTVNRVTNGGTLYLDGAPIATFNPRLGNMSGGAPLWLGRHHPNASDPGQHYFLGSLDEVEIFNRALAGSEIAAIFNAHQRGKCKPTGHPTPTPTVGPCLWCYSDVPIGSAFYTFISYLGYQHVISGYSDDTFRPFNSITRGQIAKVVALAAGFRDIPTGQTFADVPSTQPFYLWIEEMSARGIIAGYGCGGPGEPCDSQHRPYFRPYANATRGQLSKIVVLTAMFPDTPTGQTFADVPATQPFYAFIEVMAGRGIISGYGCGGPGEPCDSQHRPYFRPYANVTRGQAAKIVANTFAPDCTVAP